MGRYFLPACRFLCRAWFVNLSLPLNKNYLIQTQSSVTPGNSVFTWRIALWLDQGRNKVGKWGTIPRASNHYRGDE